MTRYAMYEQLVNAVAPATGRHLAVSGSGPLCDRLGLTGEVVPAAFPEHNLVSLGFGDEEFDSIVSDQVLEHVEGDPQLAFAESARVLRPGALAVHTTCFMNPRHSAPGDYWRFTPDALRLLAERAGFDVIDAGGHGNFAVVVMIRLGLAFTPVPHNRWHPFHWIATHNQTDWPVTTWVVARKR